jgi:hypothetical protein
VASDLLDNLSQYLIGLGIARSPIVAGTGHPLYIEPRDGVVAPGEAQGVKDDPDVTFGIFRSGDVPPQPLESFIQEEGVDLWIRVKRGQDAIVQHNAIFNALLNRSDLGQNFTMGSMNILQVQQWRPFQPLDRGPQGFTYTVGYLFAHRTAA